MPCPPADRQRGAPPRCTARELAETFPVRMMTCSDASAQGAYGVRTGSLPRTFSVTHPRDDPRHGSNLCSDRADPGARRVLACLPGQGTCPGRAGGDESSPPWGAARLGERHGGGDSPPPWLAAHFCTGSELSRQHDRCCGVAGQAPLAGIPRWCGLHTTVGPACSFFSVLTWRRSNPARARAGTGTPGRAHAQRRDARTSSAARPAVTPRTAPAWPESPRRAVRGARRGRRE